MNNLKIFENDNFGEIRTIVDNNGVIWFVASDICKALNLSNPTMSVGRLDDDEKAKLNLGLSGGATNVVNEFGLYNLVLASRKPEAKSFKRWITHDVVPAIKKEGIYMTDKKAAEILANPDSIIEIANRWKKAEANLALAQTQIEENKPKVLFADTVETAKDSILVGDLAKILNQKGVDIGGTRFFAWLREYGYLCKSKGERWNTPTQKSMELGLFEVKVRSVNNPDGSTRITRTPKVTGKGQIYFVNKFLG